MVTSDHGATRTLKNSLVAVWSPSDHTATKIKHSTLLVVWSQSDHAATKINQASWNKWGKNPSNEENRPSNAITGLTFCHFCVVAPLIGRSFEEKHPSNEAKHPSWALFLESTKVGSVVNAYERPLSAFGTYWNFNHSNLLAWWLRCDYGVLGDYGVVTTVTTVCCYQNET